MTAVNKPSVTSKCLKTGLMDIPLLLVSCTSCQLGFQGIYKIGSIFAHGIGLNKNIWFQSIHNKVPSFLGIFRPYANMNGAAVALSLLGCVIGLSALAEVRRYFKAKDSAGNPIEDSYIDATRFITVVMLPRYEWLSHPIIAIIRRGLNPKKGIF